MNEVGSGSPCPGSNVQRLTEIADSYLGSDRSPTRMNPWCRGRESNPHREGRAIPQYFKILVGRVVGTISLNIGIT